MVRPQATLMAVFIFLSFHPVNAEEAVPVASSPQVLPPGGSAPSSQAASPFSPRSSGLLRSSQPVIPSVARPVMPGLGGSSQPVIPSIARPVMPGLGGLFRVRRADIAVNGTCKADINRLCHTVKPGRGAVAHCLRAQIALTMSRKETPLYRPCQDEVRRFFISIPTMGASSNPSRLFKVSPVQGLNADCLHDGQTLCANLNGTRLLGCMKTQWRLHKLSPKCQVKMFDTIRQQAKDINLAPSFARECQDDLHRVCSSLPETSYYGQKLQCLKEHRKDLSDSCREKLFQREQDSAQDVRLDASFSSSCKAEISQFCSDKEYGQGRILKCLWQKVDNHGFSSKCRAHVDALTKRSVEDYRLDARISSKCSSAIDTLCASEKRVVDSLSAAELFGDNWMEGTSGSVLRCLKNNYPKISASSGCKDEIKRLVSIHSTDARKAPVLHRACNADIDRYCNTTRAGMVHICLRTNLAKLSPECRSEELLQGKLEARDIGMKSFMARACSSAISKFCSDVAPGSAQVIKCLQDNVRKESFPGPCRDVVEADLEASNNDWHLKFGIGEYCQDDAKRLCSDAILVGGGKVLECLKGKTSRILGSQCRTEMHRFVRQGAENIRFAADTHNACIDDVSRFCKDVQPGDGRVHDCLMRYRSQISWSCARKEFQEQELQAADIRLNPRAVHACNGVMTTICTERSTAGSRWRCLEEHKNHASMTLPCRAVVMAHVRLQNSDFYLNPALSKHCKDDAATLCAAEIALADYKDFSSEGAVIGCLIDNRNSVTDRDCKSTLMTKMIQRLGSIDHDPLVSKLCKQDITEHCADAKRLDTMQASAVHSCLQEHYSVISAPCRSMQYRNMVMASEDIRLSPNLYRECKQSVAKFCDDVPTTKATRCLLRYQKEVAIGCRTQLSSDMARRSGSLAFNPTLNKECQNDLGRLQKEHSTEMKCQLNKDNEQLNGFRISCLTAHRNKIRKHECQSALRNILRVQSMDVRSKPLMAYYCQNDIKSRCEGKGYQDLHRCLRDNVDRLESSQCEEMVREVSDAESDDVMLNPSVSQACLNEKKTFCKDVHHGQGRLGVCLKMYESEDGFSRACRGALELVRVNATVVAALRGSKQHIIGNATATQILRTLELNTGFWERWGGFVIAAIASSTTVILAGIVWILMNQNSMKAYTVAVADQ